MASKPASRSCQIGLVTTLAFYCRRNLKTPEAECERAPISPDVLMQRQQRLLILLWSGRNASGSGFKNGGSADQLMDLNSSEEEETERVLHV